MAHRMRSAARPSASWSPDVRAEVWSQGCDQLELLISRLAPVLTPEEVATMLSVTLEEVRQLFDVFGDPPDPATGDPGDEGILRESVIQFLRDTEI